MRNDDRKLRKRREQMNSADAKCTTTRACTVPLWVCATSFVYSATQFMVIWSPIYSHAVRPKVVSVSYHLVRDSLIFIRCPDLRSGHQSEPIMVPRRVNELCLTSCANVFSSRLTSSTLFPPQPRNYRV